MSLLRILAISLACLVTLSSAADAARYRYKSQHSYVHASPRAYGYYHGPTRGYGLPRSGTSAAARFQDKFRNTY
jgi:hypothetical protein